MNPNPTERESMSQLEKLRQLPKVIVNGTETFIYFHEYAKGDGPAIELMSWDEDNQEVEPYLFATVNGDFDLQDGEVAIKNYSDNDGVLPALIAAGIVSPVIRRQAVGGYGASVDICKLLIEPENPDIDWEE